MKRCKKLLSVLCAAVLLLELLPGSVLGAPVVGETLSSHGATATVTNLYEYGKSQVVDFNVVPAETRATTYHTYFFYSPSAQKFVPGFDGLPLVERYQKNGMWYTENPLHLSYPLGEGEPTDYRLSELYCPSSPAPLGGVRYKALDRNQNACDLAAAGSGILGGSLTIQTGGYTDRAGIHVFIPGGSLIRGAEPAYAVLPLQEVGVSAEKTLSFTFTLAQPLPQITNVFLYHVFWGSDGTVQVSGGCEGLHFLCASYDDDGKMLEIRSLSPETVWITGESYGEDSYESDPYYTGQMSNSAEAATIKVFSLNADYSPAGPILEQPQEIASIDLATMGSEAEKGYASLQLTGVAGDAVLEEPEYLEELEEARPIAAVDASINGSALAEGDIAVLRFKYRSDDLSDKALGAAALLPAWYREVYDPETETVQRSWVPEDYYLIDEEHNEVIVFTEHFSNHALFEVNGSGTRHAIATALNASRLSSMSEEVAEKLIRGVNQNPGVDRAELFFSFFGKTSENGWILGVDAFSSLGSALHAGEGVANSLYGAAASTIGRLGIAAAAVRVSASAYSNGVFSYETFQAATEGGIGTATYLSGNPVAATTLLVISAMKLSGEWMKESYNNATNDRFEKALKSYNRIRERSQNALSREEYWKTRLADPYRVYFSDIRTETYQTSINRFNTSVERLLDDYVYAFYQDYQAGRLSNLPVPNTYNLNLCADVCEHYKVTLRHQVAPVLKYYAGLAQVNALKSMQSELDALREELNKTVSVTFQVASDSPNQLPEGAYALFTGADKREWRVDFENGTATLEFTLYSYLERGLPASITVFNKEDRPICQLSMPAALRTSRSPAGAYTVQFRVEDYDKYISFEEERRHGDDPYRYAFSDVVLAHEDGTLTDLRFLLDEEGSASGCINTRDYREAGYPTQLRVLGSNNRLLYSAPFDFSANTICLRNDLLRVDVVCENEESVEHFRGKTVTLTAVRDKQVRESTYTTLSNTGTAALYLPEPERTWMDDTYRLFVSDGSSTPQELAFGVAKNDTSHILSFNEDGTCLVTLSCTESMDGSEPELELGTGSVSLVNGQLYTLPILAGEIGEVVTRNRRVAIASRDCISAVGKGSTTIEFRDANHPDHSVVVAVDVADAPPSPGGWYRFVCSYVRTTSNYPEYSHYVDEIRTYPDGTKGTLCYINVGYTGVGAGVSTIEITNYNDDGTPAGNTASRYRQPEGGSKMYVYNSMYDSYGENDWMIYTGYSFYGESHGSYANGKDTWERHYIFWRVSEP